VIKVSKKKFAKSQPQIRRGAALSWPPVLKWRATTEDDEHYVYAIAL